jgi:hypothetical protein
MKLTKELKKQISLIEQGEVLTCTVIFKDGDTEIMRNVGIAMTGYDEYHDGEPSDESIFYYCESMDEFKSLLDPNAKRNVVVVSFKGRKADYDTRQVLTYKADGWTLVLDGYMVGGHWKYTAIDPDGEHYNAGNDWCFQDGDGEFIEAPLIDDLTDVLIDVDDVMDGYFGYNVSTMPSYDRWVLQK